LSHPEEREEWPCPPRVLVKRRLEATAADAVTRGTDAVRGREGEKKRGLSCCNNGRHQPFVFAHSQVGCCLLHLFGSELDYKRLGDAGALALRKNTHLKTARWVSRIPLSLSVKKLYMEMKLSLYDADSDAESDDHDSTKQGDGGHGSQGLMTARRQSMRGQRPASGGPRQLVL
jgi:hypothetical protein